MVGYRRFVEEVGEFMDKIGRRDEVLVVAVSKGVDVERILQAYRQGCRHFGENRVQEAARKLPKIDAEDITWHMIGHLQRNKVSKAVRLFQVVQSIDRREIAEALSRRLEHPMEVFVEVNTSGEPQKHGVSPHEADDLIEYVRSLPNLRLVGLMTVGPYPVEERRSRRAFALLREIAERHGLPKISAGMTEDWKYALMEGANVLRIGRGIFGPRS
ncbi:MAG: YggS family pyridoxal phosphate-dependent enzyme [Thermotogae bacterium]|nr:YggS family pyridoxal phosphate-dependent enzyme [Thermotogota bacterium]